MSAKESNGEKYGTFRHFLSDMEPFFFRRKLVYVDVGAYTGSIFSQVLSSSLSIFEAHLFEPNPENFARLEEAARKRFSGRTLNLYNVAVGAEKGSVKLKPAKDMTKVIEMDRLQADRDNAIEVSAVTLDDVSPAFLDRHISILKIDVEGYEDRVLQGANKLLGDQSIDVIYLEAGMNPAATQQCHYRRIDDLLTQKGYRIFKIYEQQHEWLDDSPLLRRVNIAYFSRRFADLRPFSQIEEIRSVTKELNATKERLDSLEKELHAAKARADALNKELHAAKQRAASPIGTWLGKIRAK